MNEGITIGGLCQYNALTRRRGSLSRMYFMSAMIFAAWMLLDGLIGNQLGMMAAFVGAAFCGKMADSTV
jgi:hypothetical protein